jgi:DNA polymerase II large subunit
MKTIDDSDIIASNCARYFVQKETNETLQIRMSEGKSTMGCSDDPADLAVKLDALLAKSAAECTAIGAYLRTQVERLYSLPRVAGRVLEELAHA